MNPDSRDQLQASLGASYVLGRGLGRGGMATVYLAQDTKHHRPVALKVLHPELAASLGPERFRREIELAARLQHPHILSVYDSGEAASGQLWFTMPYVEGESLRARLQREHQLPIADAVRIAHEVADALVYAHAHGVIHRDVKPENILLSGDHALLADFGLARPLMDGASGPGGVTLTGSGLALGTAGYMSPEQASGERTVDARTDIYALGVVLYEMLAGEPPFTGPSAQAMIAKMMRGVVPAVEEQRPSVSPALASVVRTALAPAPADRYATAAAFRKALDVAELASAAAPTATGPATRSRPRVPVGLALLGLGICIGAGFLFAWRSSWRGSVTGRAVRVAVLPFDNLGDSADAYFADGITDALRGKLAALPGIEVIGATSSAHYHHSSKSAQEIGHELGARYLLIGKVRWAKVPGHESRVEVSPELVDAQSSATRWGAPFDAALTDVFRVQADVASQVAQALGLALSTGAHDSLRARPTQNEAAYNAYLQGTSAMRGDVDEALPGAVSPTRQHAIVALNQATRLDSAFADAWAALAVAESLQYAEGAGFSQPDSALGVSAKADADRAIALAPRSADAHRAESAYHRYVLNDFAGAMTEDSLALRVRPNDVETLSDLGASYAGLGHADAAVPLLQRAQMLDPRSTHAAHELSFTLRLAGRADDAAAAAERGLAIDPINLGLLNDLGSAWQIVGDTARSRAALMRVRAIDPTNVAVILRLVVSHLNVGDLDGARNVANATYPEILPDVQTVQLSEFDVPWVLDDARQRRLFNIPVAIFAPDQKPASFRDRFLALAHTAWLRGNTRGARAYGDSAIGPASAVLRANPGNADAHELLAVAEAYAGARQTALRDAHAGTALAPLRPGLDAAAYDQVQLARVFTILGDADSAAAALEPVPAAAPLFWSRAWLRIDPTWAPLRTNSRFQRLIADSASAKRPVA